MAVNIDFEKMLGLAPAIVQDAATGEVLMLGFMNQTAFDKTLQSGLCDLLQPHPKPALDQGRDLGQSTEGRLGTSGLRFRYHPLPGAGRRGRRRLSYRHANLL